MKVVFTSLCFLLTVCCCAQGNDKQYLQATMTAFHQGLVTSDTVILKKLSDKALSYGHSNGWVESKNDLINDLKTGLISYQRFDEDSVAVVINENLANIRFIANVEATMKGNTASYHLKVLEVWVKKTKDWVLFARQAVKG